MVLGHVLGNGEKPEKGVKYNEAIEKNVTILNEDTFYALIATSVEELKKKVPVVSKIGKQVSNR